MITGVPVITGARVGRRYPLASGLPGLISHKVCLKMFCRSRLPHKSVNLSFIITYMKKKLALTSAGAHHSYPTESVHKVVLQNSILAQIRQRVLFYYKREEYVNGSVRELTFAKRLYMHFSEDKLSPSTETLYPTYCTKSDGFEQVKRSNSLIFSTF